MNSGSTNVVMELRHPKHVLVCGIFLLLLRGPSFGMVVVDAFLNPARFPPSAGVGLAFMWTLVMLLCGYLILAYFRHHILVTREIVHVRDFFQTREVRLANLTRAMWKSKFGRAPLS
jgi:hypothetical protein